MHGILASTTNDYNCVPIVHADLIKHVQNIVIGLLNDTLTSRVMTDLHGKDPILVDNNQPADGSLIISLLVVHSQLFVSLTGLDQGLIQAETQDHILRIETRGVMYALTQESTAADADSSANIEGIT